MNINFKPTIFATATFVSAFLIGAQPSEAQMIGSNSESTSTSSAEVQSSAYANSSGGSGGAGYGGSGYGGSASGYGGTSQVYLDQRAPGSTTTTLKAAPAVQPPSMGSGHPCSIGGSIGISIIGGGLAGGANKVDEACLLAQMGQGQAALIMIARRDAEACMALRQTGAISAAALCSSSEVRDAKRAQRSQASLSTRQSATPDISSVVTCSRNDSGQLIARKKRGARAFTEEQVANFCRSQMQ